MGTAEQALKDLQIAGRPERVESTERFFKAYPGGYSDGDRFLCAGVPATRRIARLYGDLPPDEVALLLASEWHDARLLAVIILVERFKRADEAGRRTIHGFYMERIDRVNNWDLVDVSAEHVVGRYLDNKPQKMQVLTALATSDVLWNRRIAMIATFAYIKDGRSDEALVITKLLLNDTHDLMHKAVGWMLREVGKRVSRADLVQFLDEYAATMPRTTLRYATEHLPPERRAYYLALRRTV